MHNSTAAGMTFTIPEIERIYGNSFVNGNRVKLLWKGRELFEAIFDSISKAKKIVCLEFYIFRNDETGAELARLLKKKAREGVYVYVLYDHFGSFGTPLKFWADMKKARINVRASRPFKWTAPFQYLYRDHKKLIIIDGEKAFTGGLNIANEYKGYRLRRQRKRVKSWRDTGIMLEGPVSRSLLDEFRKSWVIWGGEPILFEGQETPSADGLPVIPIFASSSRGRRKLRRLLYYSINHSRESILLTTAYFTPSRRMIDALTDAVNRGVKVRILLPYESDVPAAHYAGRALFTRLLRAGIEIYNYRGNILHAKTSVFDGCWSIIGSANLDFQSLRWNDEGNVGILDKGFGKQMIDIFHEDMEESIKIELKQWLKRGFLEKVKERFFALFRRRL